MARENYPNQKNTLNSSNLKRSREEVALLEHLRRGKLYFAAEQYEDAKKEHQQANRLLNQAIAGEIPHPSLSKSELLDSLGTCNLQLGKISESSANFSEAKISGDDATSKVSSTFAEAENFYSDAISAYQDLFKENASVNNLLIFESALSDISKTYIRFSKVSNLAATKKTYYLELGTQIRLKVIEMLDLVLTMYKEPALSSPIFLKLLTAHDDLMTLYYSHNNRPRAIEHCTLLIKLKLESSIIGEANFTKTSTHFTHYALAENFRLLAELQASNNQDTQIVIENLERAIEYFEQAHKKGEKLAKEHYHQFIYFIEKVRQHYSDNNNKEKMFKYILIQQSYQQIYEEKWPSLELQDLESWGTTYGLLALIEPDDEKKILHYQKAIAYIEKALEYDLETAKAKEAADYLIKNLYLFLINVYIKQHKLKLAEDLYERAVRLARQHSIEATPLLSEMSRYTAQVLLGRSPKPVAASVTTNPTRLPASDTPSVTNPISLPESDAPSTTNNFWTIAITTGLPLLILILTGIFIFRKKKTKKRSSKHLTIKQPTATTALATTNDNEEVTDNILEAEIPIAVSSITSPNTGLGIASTTKADTIIRRVPKGKNQDTQQREEENKKNHRKLNSKLDVLFSQSIDLKRILIQSESNLANDAIFAKIENQYEKGYPIELTTQALKIENDKLVDWQQEVEVIQKNHDDFVAKKRIINNGNRCEVSVPDEKKATSRSIPKIPAYGSQIIPVADEKKFTSSTKENLGSQYGLDNQWLVEELKHLEDEVMPIATKSGCTYGDIKTMRYMLAGILIRLLHKVAQCHNVFPPATTDQAKTIRNNISHGFHKIYTPITTENFSSETIKNDNALLYDHALKLIIYLNEVNQNLSRVVENGDLSAQLELNLKCYIKPSIKTKERLLDLAKRYYQDWSALCSNSDPADSMQVIAIGFLCAVGGAQAILLAPNQRGEFIKMLEVGREFRHAPDYHHYAQMGRDSIMMTRASEEAPKAPEGGLFTPEPREKKLARLPSSSAAVRPPTPI